MIKIITLNANGIRAAHKKGFFEWMGAQNADVVCIQETKAHVHQLLQAIASPDNYFGFFSDAQKKGYAGVAIYTKKQPLDVKRILGFRHADTEGRYIEADFGDVSVISLYLPSGSSGGDRQRIKFDFLDQLMPVLKHYRQQKKHYIICGDWNIAHKEIDLKNWRQNQQNSGFLPEERAWMDKLFDEVGMVDAFRQVNPSADQYTWWSNRGAAWAKNVGWRIDYQIISPDLSGKVLDASIYKEQRFSDHAPLTITYDIQSV